MKNIVICCDGTGNEISENISNVLKLYRVLRKTDKTDPHQVVFYDPGVGTLARPNPWTKFWQDSIANLGLLTGYGLDDNILSAYRFLISRYEEGDAIYLFGFSRGAYAVRVLAGLVNRVGLLSADQINLAGAALTAYKQAASDVQDIVGLETADVRGNDEFHDSFNTIIRKDRATQFARIVSTRWPTIKFVGVWDTVASVIVPRPDRFYTFSLLNLPHTQLNPSVKIFRQAIAIDERRRMFRLHSWEQPQMFMNNRFSKTNNAEPQDTQQVWFAGAHADVGGGYPESESGLSKFPLLWLIDEAVRHGLSVNRRTVNQLAWGVQRKNSPFHYVAPCIKQNPHQSLSKAWKVLEWLPKSNKYKEWPERTSLLGYYLPGGEPRPIPSGAFIHESVINRMREVKTYKPKNIPSSHQIVPLSIQANHQVNEA